MQRNAYQCQIHKNKVGFLRVDATVQTMDGAPLEPIGETPLVRSQILPPCREKTFGQNATMERMGML